MRYEHVFDELDIKAEPFALCELLGRCDMDLGYRSVATLHYVLAGTGEIIISGSPPIPVQTGTLVLVPASKSHTLRSFGSLHQTRPTCRPAELELEHHLMAGVNPHPERKLLAICSQIQVGLRGVGGLIDLIRKPLVSQVEPNSVLSAAIEALLRELSDPRLGSRAMIRVLLTQCLISLLRNRLEGQDPGLKWMAALADEKLWSALQQMIDAPGDPHTVESLAFAAGMSRSTFAKRFSDVYGNGPMALLRNLRMQMAASLLSETDLPIKRVAEKIGFQSRTTFSRKFEEMIGIAPNNYRKEGRSA